MTTETLDKPAETHVNWFSEDAATFGDRLAAAREASNLSQAELAERIGVKTRVIEQWEADSKEPRANRLQMLAGMLGVSLMWLLTGEGDGVEIADDSETDIADLRGLLGELRQLRTEIGAMSGRIGRVEKRLRQVIANGAE
ncbi:MAG: helix-turn-helix transcriptional regulator [Paracoccaceae bacterium]